MQDHPTRPVDLLCIVCTATAADESPERTAVNVLARASRTALLCKEHRDQVAAATPAVQPNRHARRAAIASRKG